MRRIDYPPLTCPGTSILAHLITLNAVLVLGNDGQFKPVESGLHFRADQDDVARVVHGGDAQQRLHSIGVNGGFLVLVCVRV